MNSENNPHVKEAPIKYTKGYRTKLMIRKLIKLTVSLFLISIVAATMYVLVVEPVRTENGYIKAISNNSAVSKGDKVIVVNDNSYNILSPIKRAIVIQDVYIGEVIAGPYGEIKGVQGNFKVVDKKEIIQTQITDKGDGFLDNQYIIRKIENTDKLEEVIVDIDNILGINE